MKFLILFSLMLNFALAQSAPTQNQEAEVETSPTSESPAGMTNYSGISTEEMNTSTNPAPENEEEAVEGSLIQGEESFEIGPYTREGEYNFSQPEAEEATGP